MIGFTIHILAYSDRSSDTFAALYEGMIRRLITVITINRYRIAD